MASFRQALSNQEIDYSLERYVPQEVVESHDFTMRTKKVRAVMMLKRQSREALAVI